MAPTKKQHPVPTTASSQRQPRVPPLPASRTTTATTAASSCQQQQPQHGSSFAFLKLSASPASEKFTPSNVILLSSKAMEELKLMVGSLVEVSAASSRSAHTARATKASSPPPPLVLAVLRDSEQDRLRKSSMARFSASTLVTLIDNNNNNTGNDANHSSDDDDDGADNEGAANDEVIVKSFARCDVDDLTEVIIRQRQRSDVETRDNDEHDQELDIVEQSHAFERSIPRDSGAASMLFAGMIVLCSFGARMIEMQVVSIKFLVSSSGSASPSRTGYFASSTILKNEKQLQPHHENASRHENEIATPKRVGTIRFIVGDHGSGKTTKLQKIQSAATKPSKWISGGGIAALPSTRDKIQFLRSLALHSLSSPPRAAPIFLVDDIHLFLASDQLVVAVFVNVLKQLKSRGSDVVCSVLSTSGSSSSSSKPRIEDILPREVLSIEGQDVIDYLTLPSTEERIEILQSLLTTTTTANRSLSQESSSFNNNNYHNDNDTSNIDNHSRRMVSKEVIADIASTAYGYSPLDFKVLIDVARSYAYSAGGGGAAGADPVVSESALRKARRAVQPASLKSINAVSPPPSMSWSDIGGSDEAKRSLQDCLTFANEKAQRQFAKFGVSAPRGVLLFGPPGCSKTMLARCVASQGKMNFISVKGPEVFSKWVGDSEKAVRDIFDRARAAAPCVVFIDELDGMCGKRGGGGVGDRVISQLLVELDGLPKNASSSSSSSGIIFIAATNRPDVLDDAILRPGRIDRKIYVGLPSEADRAQIIQIALKGIPLAQAEILDTNYLTNDLAKQTQGYTGAEIVSLCKRASALAVYEDVGADVVERRHFDQAKKEVVPRVQQKDIEWYQQWSHATTKIY